MVFCGKLAFMAKKSPFFSHVAEVFQCVAENHESVGWLWDGWNISHSCLMAIPFPISLKEPPGSHAIAKIKPQIGAKKPKFFLQVLQSRKSCVADNLSNQSSWKAGQHSEI
jgi:hypothetical protein